MMDDLEFVKDLLKRARADVAYLEAQLEKSRKEWTKELDAAEEGWRLANRQLEAVREISDDSNLSWQQRHVATWLVVHPEAAIGEVKP